MSFHTAWSSIMCFRPWHLHTKLSFFLSFLPLRLVWKRRCAETLSAGLSNAGRSGAEMHGIAKPRSGSTQCGNVAKPIVLHTYSNSFIVASSPRVNDCILTPPTVASFLHAGDCFLTPSIVASSPNVSRWVSITKYLLLPQTHCNKRSVNWCLLYWVSEYQEKSLPKSENRKWVKTRLFHDGRRIARNRINYKKFLYYLL